MTGAVWDWLARQADIVPGAPFLETVDGAFSFGAWHARVQRVVGRLEALGVQPGDRVALRLHAGYQWVEVLFAAVRLGAVLVPLNTRLTASELAHQLAVTTPALLIDEAGEPPIPFAGPRLTLDPDEPPAADRLLGDPSNRVASEGRALQSIIFTSGTTGSPKGACLTLAQQAWAAMGSALRLGHDPDDVWLLAMPLYHVGGQAILWRAVLAGIPVVLRPRFDADDVARFMASGRVTLVSLVPTMLRRVLDAHPGPFSPRLRVVLIGGAALPPALADEARARGLPIVATYGMTETASQMATEVPGRPGPPGTSGRPLLGVAMRIGDPGSDGVGEIEVRGPQVIAGYWGEPPGQGPSFTDDGWFRTGDLGRFREDGSLEVVDRRSDLIVTGGENVYPAEVEAVLLRHPAVVQAGVAGVPDPAWGRRVEAWVVLREPTAARELEAHCRRWLAGYKVPRAWHVVRRLPVTANGKVRRAALPSWRDDPEGWGEHESS